jgi:hypothetical protein
MPDEFLPAPILDATGFSYRYQKPFFLRDGCSQSCKLISLDTASMIDVPGRRRPTVCVEVFRRFFSR